MADRIHPERSGGFARAENKPRRFWIGNAACGGEPVSQVNGTPVFFCRPKRRIILWADFKWGKGRAASRPDFYSCAGENYLQTLENTDFFRLQKNFYHYFLYICK
nr:hypothetical protein [Bacillaceae bacterium]